MSEIASAGLTQPVPSGRPARRRLVLIGLMAFIVLALALVYLRWWTRPSTFTETGHGFSSEQTMGALHPVSFDMAQRSLQSDPESITLNEVSPRVLTNTTNALITFAVCHRSGTPFMSAEGPATRTCETVSGVEGQQVRLTSDLSTTISMTVRPRHVGRVVIEGMEVNYSRGASHFWQRGSQATGPTVEMRVTK